MGAHTFGYDANSSVRRRYGRLHVAQVQSQWRCGRVDPGEPRVCEKIAIHRNGVFRRDFGGDGLQRGGVDGTGARRCEGRAGGRVGREGHECETPGQCWRSAQERVLCSGFRARGGAEWREECADGALPPYLARLHEVGAGAVARDEGDEFCV